MSNAVAYIGQTVQWAQSPGAPDREWHVGVVQGFARDRATLAIMPSGNGVPFRVVESVVHHKDPSAGTRPDRDRGVWRELPGGGSGSEAMTDWAQRVESHLAAVATKIDFLERRLAALDSAEVLDRLAGLESSYARHAQEWTSAIAAIQHRLTSAGA